MTKFKGFCLKELLILMLFSSFISYGSTLGSVNLLIISRSLAWARVSRLSSIFNIQALTSQQLSKAFPKFLDGFEKTKIVLDPNKSVAIAVYGNHYYEVSITDDLSNNYSTIDSFNVQYEELGHVAKNDRVFSSIRDGYKTITTIQPENGIISMSFVLKKRYFFIVTGYHKQTSYMVWRFIELYKFKLIK